MYAKYFPAFSHIAHTACEHPILFGSFTALPVKYIFKVIDARTTRFPTILYFCVYIVFCSTFYEKEAMLMDPVDGPILASLLGSYKPH